MDLDALISNLRFRIALYAAEAAVKMSTTVEAKCLRGRFLTGIYVADVEFRYNFLFPRMLMLSMTNNQLIHLYFQLEYGEHVGLNLHHLHLLLQQRTPT